MRPSQATRSQWAYARGHGCDQCAALSINGHATHETGCPNGWRHAATGIPIDHECWECGCDYQPEERPHRHSLCPGCANPEPGPMPCDKCGGPDAVIDDIVEGNLCGDCTSELVDEE